MSHPAGFAIGIIAVFLGHIVAIFALVIWNNRRLAQIRREDGTVNAVPGKTATKLPAALRTFHSLISETS